MHEENVRFNMAPGDSDEDFAPGDDSMGDSSEEHDTCEMHATNSQQSSQDQAPFRQIDYAWLFDPYCQFKSRKDFVLDDSSLTLDDYSQMRYLNRKFLTKFLSDLQMEGIATACRNFEELQSITDEDLINDNWADEFLDEELKGVLKNRSYGSRISVDLVAHMEYFYNTLECDNRTENPFVCSAQYPALTCPVPQPHNSGSKLSEQNSSPGVKTLLQLLR